MENREVLHVGGDRASGRLHGGGSATAGEGEPGRKADAAAAVARGDLRRREPDGGGTDRRCRAAGRARLGAAVQRLGAGGADRPEGSGKTRSEEHTSELQSIMRISYAVFCLK